MKHLLQLPTGLTSCGSKRARWRTDLRIMLVAMEMAKPGTRRPCSRAPCPSSLASRMRSEKALSSTMAAIVGSRSPYSNAVVAPIEWPHNAIVDVSLLARR